MKKFIIFMLILCFLVGVFLVVKPSIHTATQEELQAITGIGEVMSEDIISYLTDNKRAKIEDLEDIEGIGCETIRKLEEVYSD